MTLAGAAALLMVGSVLAAPAWVPGEHGGPSVSMSIENWGTAVDLSTPGVVAWAHLGAVDAATHVTVRIEPGDGGLHGYYGRLTAPDAFGGQQMLYCGDEYRRIESFVICGFDVPMSRGVNRLIFDLQSASFAGMRTQEGIVLGATLEMVPVLEVRQADGSWRSVPASGEAELPGIQTSALRYRIMNTGDIPFRVPGHCQGGGTVWPYQQLLCSLRSPRPVFALAGTYRLPIEVEDPAGGTVTTVLEGSLVVPGVTFPRTQHP